MIDRSAPKPAEEHSGRPPGRGWAVTGIVSGVLAFVLIPPLFGALGILFGFVGRAKGDRRLGRIAIIVSIFSLVLGSILYAVFRNLMNV